MASRWTSGDVQRLANRGMSVEGLKQIKKKAKKAAKPESPHLREMKQWLRIMGIDFKSEHRFHDVRKFKFDIALESEKIAFEYEGIISNKSRHTSLKGYTRDADKYNLAQALGWRVFRYTALNYKNFLLDIKQLLKL